MSNSLYETRHNLLLQLAAVEIQIAEAYVNDKAQNEAGLDIDAVTQMNRDSINEDLEDAVQYLLHAAKGRVTRHVTLRKVNTVDGRKFNNSYLMVDGNAVGVVGRPFVGAEHFIFISKHPDFKHLEQYFPRNKNTFKELI